MLYQVLSESAFSHYDNAIGHYDSAINHYDNAIGHYDSILTVHLPIKGNYYIILEEETFILSVWNHSFLRYFKYRDFKGAIKQKKEVVKPIQYILTFIINSIEKERYVWNSLVSIHHKSKLKLFVLFYLFIKNIYSNFNKYKFSHDVLYLSD